MKILKLDYDNYCCYPEGISSIEEFMAFVNKNYHSFVPFTCFDTENCVHPYFIEEDTKRIYMNLAEIGQITEEEVTVLSRAEYEARLQKVVAAKCLDCENYVHNPDGDNLHGHRGRLSLDGECWSYSRKTEDD